MAEHHKAASGDEFAEHEATYKGFLKLLKISTGATIAALVLLYFFLAR
ncbi:aa3-type cytochrome c oxidase subunit IV [Methylosinus sp. Sm6]|nr:aa3-type cytochrome c oxidase subunit IV [Methylosinus sp. Sm6]MBY6241748.1 aa3-type cytochrome c oxidase subunit IV [Methylosinus sp. Sm6]